MTFRFTTVFIALGSLTLASCYPYAENPQKPAEKPEPQRTVTSAEQQKIKAERDRLKKREAAKKEEIRSTVERSTPNETDNNPKPTVQPRREYDVANKVPGKEGFVFSPYNNKIVDVRDIPTGTLVQDPTFPAAEKKFFRVP